MGITLDYYRILVKQPIGTIPDTAVYANPTAFASYYVLNSSGSLTDRSIWVPIALRIRRRPAATFFMTRPIPGSSAPTVSI